MPGCLCRFHFGKESGETFENRRLENYGNWIKFWKMALNSTAMQPQLTLPHFSFTTSNCLIFCSTGKQPNHKKERDCRKMKWSCSQCKQMQAHVQHWCTFAPTLNEEQEAGGSVHYALFLFMVYLEDFSLQNKHTSFVKLYVFSLIKLVLFILHG